GSQRPRVRKQALLEPDDEDDAPLPALGLVDRGQEDALLSGVWNCDLLAEAQLVQPGAQVVPGPPGQLAERVELLQPPRRVRLAGQPVAVAAALERQVQQRRRREPLGLCV